MKRFSKILGLIFCFPTAASTIVIMILMLLFMCNNVCATPYLYTIEGQVIEGPGIVDNAGYLSNLGITIGSAVSYTFIIDLNAPATIQYGNGTVEPYSLGLPTFYSHYVTGSTIVPEDYLSTSLPAFFPQNYSTYNGIAALNFADYILSSNDYGLMISNGNNYLTFGDMFQNPNSSGYWPLNSSFGATCMINSIFNSDGSYSRFYFDAKITSVQPVPEPCTMLLLCSGLLGLAGFRKLFK